MHVCNYGVGGNYVGEPVYSQGPAGSACPKGTPNNDGLCLWKIPFWKVNYCNQYKTRLGQPFIIPNTQFKQRK